MGCGVQKLLLLLLLLLLEYQGGSCGAGDPGYGRSSTSTVHGAATSSRM